MRIVRIHCAPLATPSLLRLLLSSGNNASTKGARRTQNAEREKENKLKKNTSYEARTQQKNKKRKGQQTVTYQYLHLKWFGVVDDVRNYTAH